jgi:type III secretion protein V
MADSSKATALPLSGSDRLEAMLRLLTRRSDLLLAAMVLAVVALMVFPLTPFALDTLIAVNLAASLGLLMLSLYIPSALGLSTFPSLLLLTTLFRLSLNIASTKQILMHANAGHIIDTFGKLIVGGSVIVGGVVFLIIAIVQFIVIAKGAERVAEVGARFTLDAMPGKQMSIDADLRAGNISPEEARRRRSLLGQESQLHGAMDGAMKFVKGDAVAALIIAVINILAGIAIGSLVHGMAVGEAIDRYAILTVGDGMVSQIPSLLVSIAAGILITRVSTDDDSTHLGGQIGKQVLAHPMALLITGAMLFTFMTVPGFPKGQFLILGAAIGGVGYFLLRQRKNLATYERTPMPGMRRDGALDAPHLIDEVDSTMTVPLLVKLSPNLRGKLEPSALDRELQHVRAKLQLELGIPFPGVRMTYDPGLAPSAYAIWVQEIPVARGLLGRQEGQPTAALLMQSAQDRGVGTLIEPAAAALVALDTARAAAQESSATSVSDEQRLALHLEQTIRQHAASLIGMQEVKDLVKKAEAELPELATEVLRVVSLQRVTEVLRRLVQEAVSIRNLRAIFESLIVWGPKEKDIVLLTEYVRVDLGRQITFKYSQGRDSLNVIMFDPRVETLVREAIQQSVSGNYLALAPEVSASLVDKVRQLASHPDAGNAALVLTSMDVRRYVKKLLEPALPALPVLSYQELSGNTMIHPIGRVEL